MSNDQDPDNSFNKFDWVSNSANEVFRVGLSKARGEPSNSGVLVQMQMGDDGNWWDVGSQFDSYWIDTLIKALQSAKRALKTVKD